MKFNYIKQYGTKNHGNYFIDIMLRYWTTCFLLHRTTHIMRNILFFRPCKSFATRNYAYLGKIRRILQLSELTSSDIRCNIKDLSFSWRELQHKLGLRQGSDRDNPRFIHGRFLWHRSISPCQESSVPSSFSHLSPTTMAPRATPSPCMAWASHHMR